jgi:ParB family chromosome partitioning protein
MTQRLGKGLDALIPSLHIDESDNVIQIPLGQLRANPYQPRKIFNEDAINELAQSIKEHGIIQPIIVRKVLKGFEIIAGERRFRASQLAGLSTISAVERNFTDQQVMEITLIENLQREDLNAIEIANAYQSLIDKFSLTQEQLSVKVGKSRSHIANFLRILQLPEEIREYVSRGTISMGHAKSIAGVKNDDLKKKLAEEVIQMDMSVRDLEEKINHLDDKNTKNNPKKDTEHKRDPYITEVENQLRAILKTSVKIKNQNNKGKIEIVYYTKDDLNRLIDFMQN